MSIEVRIPKEITEYKEKIMFGMSGRQLICFVAAIVLGIGSYVLCTSVLGLTMDTAGYVIILLSLPLLAVGFIKKNGFTFEKYAYMIVRHTIGQQIRPYKTELLIDKISTTEEAPKRKGNYAWIFERQSYKNTGGGELRNGASEISTCNKKGRKAKRKATLRTIKAARQEHRAVKQGAYK